MMVREDHPDNVIIGVAPWSIVVSTVISAAVAGLTFPAVSVRVTEMLVRPSGRAMFGVHVTDVLVAGAGAHVQPVIVAVSPMFVTTTTSGVESSVIYGTDVSASTEVMTGAVGAEVSTIATRTGADAGLVLPAASVCVAVTLYVPSGRDGEAVSVTVPPTQVPVAIAVVPSCQRVTVASVSQVSVKSGVVSDVTLSVPLVPVSVAVVISGTEGAAGAVVSTVISAAVAGLTFPAVSVRVTEMLVRPSGRAMFGVHVTDVLVAGAGAHVQPVIVAVSPMFVTTTTSGVESSVIYGTDVSASTEVMTGAVGAEVSTIATRTGADAGLVLPAASVCVAVTLYVPSGRDGEAVSVTVPPTQVPVAIAVVPSCQRVTVASVSQVSVKSGVVSDVTLSVPLVPVSVAVVISGTEGAAGAVVSTVISAAVAGLTFPAVSVRVTEMLVRPSGRAMFGVHVTDVLVAGAGAHVQPVIVAVSPMFVTTTTSGVESSVIYGTDVSASTEVMTGAVGAEVSTIATRTGADAGLVLPAASVCVAVTLYVPSGRDGEAVSVTVPPTQVPVAIAVVPSCQRVTVASVSQVSVKSGVVSDVTLSVPLVPVSVAVVISGTEGAAGAVVSTVISAAVAGLTFPAVSVRVTEMLVRPSGRAMFGVHVTDVLVAGAGAHVQPVIVAVSPMFVTTTTSGVESSVIYGTDVSASTEVMTGAVGAEVSTIATRTGADAGLVLPAASVCVAVTLYVPSGRDGEAVSVTVPPTQVPVAIAVVPSCQRVTVASVSQVSVKSGVVSDVTLSVPLVPVSVAVVISGTEGAAGAVVSTTVISAAVAGLTFPAVSVRVTEMLVRPSGRAMFGVHVTDVLVAGAGAHVQPVIVAVSPMFVTTTTSGVESSVIYGTDVSASTEVMTGAVGAEVSTIATRTGADAGLVLPAASVCVAVTLYVPSGRDGEAVSVTVPPTQVPVAIAVVPSCQRVTVASVSQVSVKSGVVSDVTLSVPLVPVSVAVVISGTEGAAGAVVSIIIFLLAPREVAAPGATKVSTAGKLPDPSIVPPLRERAVVER
jgi:hypothetical protein